MEFLIKKNQEKYIAVDKTSQDLFKPLIFLDDAVVYLVL